MNAVREEDTVREDLVTHKQAGHRGSGPVLLQHDRYWKPWTLRYDDPTMGKPDGFSRAFVRGLPGAGQPIQHPDVRSSCGFK